MGSHSHLTEQKLSDLTTTTKLESGGESKEPGLLFWVQAPTANP